MAVTAHLRPPKIIGEGRRQQRFQTAQAETSPIAL